MAVLPSQAVENLGANQNHLQQVIQYCYHAYAQARGNATAQQDTYNSAKAYLQDAFNTVAGQLMQAASDVHGGVLREEQRLSTLCTRTETALKVRGGRLRARDPDRLNGWLSRAARAP